jgi:hypothetical protein
MSAVFLVERRSLNQKLEKCQKRDRYKFAPNYAPIRRVLCSAFMPRLRDQAIAESGIRRKNRCNAPETQNSAEIPGNRRIFQGAQPLSSKGHLSSESESKLGQLECAHA